MTRRQLLAIALALTVVISVFAVPALAASNDDAYSDKKSAAVEKMDGLFGTTPGFVIRYGADQYPGFFIDYEDGERDTLVDWIDDSAERELIADDNSSNRILLSAPTADVLGGLRLDGIRPRWFGSGLEGKSYVERIDVNVELDRTEPIQSPDNETDYSPPAPTVRGSWSSNGIAFNDNSENGNLSDVRANISADDVDADGNGTTVAVIDTGANIGDGQLYGNGSKDSSLRIAGAKNFITNESVNVSAGDPDWSIVEDGNGHGSWVASAIAANASGTEHDGIAPGADLLIARALDDDGSGSTQDIVDAIEWAEENGADVISMSLGSPVYSPTMADEIEEAIDGNVSLVIVAAGNSRQNPAVRYVASPADAPVDGVITVAATNVSNASTAGSAYFSNVGPDTGTRDFSRGVTAGAGPDVAAPGMKVVAKTLTTGGTEQEVELSGTSMATPIVAGAVLLALDANENWAGETEQLETDIEESASPIPGAGVTEVGAGMINASQLVDDEQSDETQRESRDPDAEGRDAANRAYSDSKVVRPINELFS
jgi:subtilisin family serine protease